VKKLGQRLVAKRDGSREPFDAAKLRRCVAAAMIECEQDVRLAGALAEAVAFHLKDWNQGHPPSTNYIFRCVRKVLRATGLDEVARSLELHRRYRADRRRDVRVIDARRPGRNGMPWRKSLLVQTLANRYGLTPPTARTLACEIEYRVLTLNYNVVSTALVAELIRNEVSAWGLADEAMLVGRSIDDGNRVGLPQSEESR
jgi:2-phosphoglycerate kinase